MSYLLDTHTLIWTITDRKKISLKALQIIENPDNIILVSAITFWEISLKSSLNKLTITGFLPEELPEIAKHYNFMLLPLLPAEAATYYNLPTIEFHKDPFDRMLIWQCIRQGSTLISKDKNMIGYRESGLKLLW